MWKGSFLIPATDCSGSSSNGAEMCDWLFHTCHFHVRLGRSQQVQRVNLDLNQWYHWHKSMILTVGSGPKGGLDTVMPATSKSPSLQAWSGYLAHHCLILLSPFNTLLPFPHPYTGLSCSSIPPGNHECQWMTWSSSAFESYGTFATAHACRIYSAGTGSC